MLSFVYRHFDGDGNLLYIGKSLNVFGRTNQHARSSKWFQEVRTITVEVFQDSIEADKCEMIYISRENPKYNVHYKNGIGEYLSARYWSAEEEANAMREAQDALAKLGNTILSSGCVSSG